MSLPTALIENAKSFLYQNGRLLDRKRFEFLFEDGSKEAVLDALKAYRNEDGGFGNALEPDIRCPQSQPVPAEMALAIMDEIGFFDPEIMKGIAKYLKSITVETGGFPLAFQSVNDYPHAPWWTVNEDNVANMNPTGSVVGLLLKQNAYTDFYEEEWFKKTVQYVWDVMDHEKPSGYHNGIQWITFLEHTPDRSKAEAYQSKIDEWLQQPGTIEKDPQAEGYVHKVLDWAPACNSYAARFVSEEDLKIHLAHLVKQQQEDGGWTISWPPVSPTCELEWRGSLTVDRLKTLRSYKVI